MADRDAHIRQVKNLTAQIRNDGASQEDRDTASAALDTAWKNYRRNGG
jgi:hypothetical protein